PAHRRSWFLGSGIRRGAGRKRRSRRPARRLRGRAFSCANLKIRVDLRPSAVQFVVPILVGVSMSRAFLCLLVIASISEAQNQQPPAIRIAASSFATTEVHVNSRPIGKNWYAEDAALTGPARIAISYGQPHARGRKVEGGLIPNDTVWRFGANDATTLHTDVDLTLGTLALPRGDYSLFVLHSAASWQLIVNSRTAIWGTDRDASK